MIQPSTLQFLKTIKKNNNKEWFLTSNENIFFYLEDLNLMFDQYLDL